MSQQSKSSLQYCHQIMEDKPRYNPNLGNFEIISKIGSGGFGNVYKVISKDRKTVGALKIQKKTIQCEENLDHEVYILEKLQKIKEIPRIIANEKGGLIIQLLGENLQEIMKTQKKLSLCSTLKIGAQVLKIIQKENIIHRDIKPQNIVLANASNHTFYLIDFGLSQDCSSTETDNKMVGTQAYTSKASHQGLKQCKKDDLECLAYMLIYLNNGKLPWQNVLRHKNVNAEIYQNKLNLEKNCEGVSPVLLKFARIVQDLEREQEIDYNYLLELLNESIKSHTCFEWCKVSCQQKDYYQCKSTKEIDAQSFDQNISENAVFGDQIVQLESEY